MLKIVVYLSALTSLLGASIFSINLGVFQLSIFRSLILFLVLAIFIILLQTNASIQLSTKKESNYSIKFMLFWLIYSIFTLIWVKDYDAWIRNIYFLSLGVACIIIFSMFLKKTSDILTTFRFMVMMIIIHNLIGWYEVLTGNYMFLSGELISLYALNNHPVSIFHNTNGFATFILISIFIVYICAVNEKRFLIKIIYIATIISSVYLLLMTSSRANILGLILAFAVFVYFSLKNRRTRAAIISFLAVLFTMGMLMPNLFDNFLQMVNNNLHFGFSSETSSDTVRTNLIKNGYIFLSNTFGFGTGAGNIEYWMANYSEYYTEGIVNMHNWWMEILVGYGVIIFTLYIIFYFKLFKSFYKRYRNSNDKKDITISLGIMCSMAGFIVGSISNSSNISNEWLWVYWAIIIAFQGIEYNRKNSFKNL
ncbi:O-antigen ligase family protein [Bacillus tuaregi]|uniref:O-antigen ligase family protein n=1 Tax=Bacillus tuaregi TaxID=1816695 RepID=UPI0008F91F85|nr:O-antigen ligase family protein [Bacillus tuaregi]